MRLFPFMRPSLGLSIGAGTLGLVEVRRGWRELSLQRCTERTLPAGLLRLSASDANVTDVSALAKEFSALLDGQGIVTRPVPITLSLPDLCARVALFEFDSVPSKPSEMEALIRWRFQKDLNMPVADARLTYQLFQPMSAHAPTGGPIRILAVAIRATVIEPYERACELAGLIPVSVGLTSLQLFGLCRSVMETALNTTEECFYLYVGEGSFAFIAIRAGVPVFLRIKPLRNGGTNGNALPHVSAVDDELLATLHFFMEQEAVSGKGSGPSRLLFLVNGDGIVPALPDSLGISIVPLSWETVRIAKQPSTIPLSAGLPALAGVMET
jgi:hypothetical protein